MLWNLSDRNRKMLASCSGTLLLIILLLLASLDIDYETETPPKIVMHEVQMYSPPPPPPPPPIKQEGTQDSPMPSLVIANAEDLVKLDIMELDVDMGDVVISGFGTGGPGSYGGDGLGKGWGYRGGWRTFSLPELDNIPMVKSYPYMTYPEIAVKNNILEFEVRIYIIIDEEGKTYPDRIVQNPFPSINKEILKYVSGVKFFPPTKGGVQVRSEYIFNLLLKAK